MTGTWLRNGRLYARVSHFSGGTVVETTAPTCNAPRQTCMGPCPIPTTPGMQCPLCVDTQTDTAHCGACGNACPTGQSGTCRVAGCPPGQTECASTCVDTMSSPIQCGACGNVCQSGQNCIAGTCQRDCATRCGRFTSCPGADIPRCLMDCQTAAPNDACQMCLAMLTNPCDRSICMGICPP